MKRYKLIKEYPGSPELNSVILSSSSEFYSVKPDKFPEFWKEFVPEKSFITDDGIIITDGDQFWLVDNKLNLFHRTFVNDIYFNQNDYKYFSTIEKAKEYIISQIELPIENEIIRGEDIILYTVLVDKSNYMIGDPTNSLKLFIRKRTKQTPISDKWKYFRTEKERNDYLYNKLKIFSRDDIRNMFESWLYEEEIEKVLSKW